MDVPAYNVVIVGAGLAGINAAHRLQTQCPELSYIILEARESLGGTWDFFRYPGIRSDTDLHTLGFAWRLWTRRDALASADKIKSYLRDSAREQEIDRKIIYSRKVKSAEWNSTQRRWRLDLLDPKSQQPLEAVSCNFVLWATGFYDYERALETTIPHLSSFTGRLIHPQFWPENLDYRDKEIVVVGSGATAVTLVPNLAKSARRVTMLQRSPGYILSLPAYDPFDAMCRKIMPESLALLLIRYKFLVLTYLFYYFSQWWPGVSRAYLQKETAKHLPETIAIDPHFSPRYNPWDQRLCLCPAGDFFEPLRTGKAAMVTDEIDHIAGKEIVLKRSKQSLHADILITATGLRLQFFGGATLSIDGQAVELSTKHLWRSTLIEEVPNTALFIGSANAAWTLGADCAAQIVTRLLARMQSTNTTMVFPKATPDGFGQDVPYIPLSSTFLKKATSRLPKSGTRGPWRIRGTYFTDYFQARWGSIRDSLVFE